MLFGADDGKHPCKLFFRCIRLRGKAQTGVEHLVRIDGLGFACGGAGKADEGTEKGVSCLLGAGDRGF